MSEATIEHSAPRRRPASAYPPAVADLMPAARRLAMKNNGVPSRRALMRELHIGGPKADLVLTELNASADIDRAPEPATPDTPDEVTDAGATSSDEPAPDAPQTDDPDDRDEASARVDTGTVPDSGTTPEPGPSTDEQRGTADEPARKRRKVSVWPVMALTLPALVAVWSGWVSLGAMAGFGVVHPLPGIVDHLTLNTAITLPIGVEVYAAYALYVWLTVGIPARARKFAKRSAIASLVTGAAGQVTYHLLSAAHFSHAPWPVTMLVACLPVAVLGMGAALAHLVRSE